MDLRSFQVMNMMTGEVFDIDEATPELAVMRAYHNSTREDGSPHLPIETVAKLCSHRLVEGALTIGCEDFGVFTDGRPIEKRRDILMEDLVDF